MTRHMTGLMPVVAVLALGSGIASAADEPVSKASPASEASTPKARPADRFCEPSAASRVQRKKAEGCDKASSPTRSYSREELDSTGQNDMGRALRQLDPRFY